VSALVTSFNSERRIGECLQALLWCDEILLVDSYSTDSTLEIAASFPGVRVIQHEYLGGAAQKNWAIPRVRGDWVLIFDSDEVCTPDLRDEIQALLQAGATHNAYTIHRRVYFLGKRIRFSGWKNDKVARLFRKGTARYEDRRVHARLLTDGPAPQLENSMLHYMVDSLSEYVTRTLKYSRWNAAQAFRDGKRSSAASIIISPAYRLIRTYFIQFGFLDGLHGLVFCMLQAAGSFCKWATLWGWRINEKRGGLLDLPKFEDGFGDQSYNEPVPASWEPNVSPPVEEAASSRPAAE
jgi:glycosyltransferase involved in cell wall biosynthesis